MQLRLFGCEYRHVSIRLIADALAGNTIMELLEITTKYITSADLDDLTRMIESTQLKTIELFHWNRGGTFEDQGATQRFVSTLERKKSSLQDLVINLPLGDRDATYAKIKPSLIRNWQLNCVVLLLAAAAAAAPLQRQRQQQQQQRYATSSSMITLKISHKAIARFATVGDGNDTAGTSAIFKLFQVRPALLEKRIKRPSPAAAIEGVQVVAKKTCIDSF
jgi:hypothetical protein